MVSIIVPIYNVEKYLPRCLESIALQTFRDLEVLLIDDGSTDSSGLIADDFALSHSSFKVFHKPNGGLSDARNYGIDKARGDFLFFLDSDDYIEPRAIDILVKRQKLFNADIVVAGANYVDENGEVLHPISGLPNKELAISGVEALNRFYGENYVYLVVAWNKLYRRSLFEHVRYPKGINNEDEATTPLLFYQSRIVALIPETTLNYVQRSSSIMGDIKSNFRIDFFRALKIREEFFLREKEYSYFCEDYFKIILFMTRCRLAYKKDLTFKKYKGEIWAEIKAKKALFLSYEKRLKRRFFVRLAIPFPLLAISIRKIRESF